MEVGGSRDFSAPHSVKHDINNTDYFWLPFAKVRNSPPASAEARLALGRAGWLLPPGVSVPPGWGDTQSPGMLRGWGIPYSFFIYFLFFFPPCSLCPGFSGARGFVSQGFEGASRCPSGVGVPAVLGAVQTRMMAVSSPKSLLVPG